MAAADWLGGRQLVMKLYQTVGPCVPFGLHLYTLPPTPAPSHLTLPPLVGTGDAFLYLTDYLSADAAI